MNICLLLVVVEPLYPAAGEAQLSHTPCHPAPNTKQKDGRSEPCRVAGRGQRVKLDQVTSMCGVQQSGWGREEQRFRRDSGRHGAGLGARQPGLGPLLAPIRPLHVDVTRRLSSYWVDIIKDHIVCIPDNHTQLVAVGRTQGWVRLCFHAWHLGGQNKSKPPALWYPARVPLTQSNPVVTLSCMEPLLVAYSAARQTLTVKTRSLCKDNPCCSANVPSTT